MRQNRKEIRKLAVRGAVPVLVVDCGATAEGEKLGTLHGVAAVLGHETEVLQRIRSYLDGFLPAVAASAAEGFLPGTVEISRSDRQGVQPPQAAQGRKIAERLTAKPLSPPLSPRIIPDPSKGVKEKDALLDQIERFEGRQRALLKVQDGCDAFCSYCIIPRLRGAPRSKPIPLVVEEARSLIQAGHRGDIHGTPPPRRFCEPRAVLKC